MIDDVAARRVMAAVALIVTTALVVAMPGRRGWFDVGVYHDAVVYWLHRPGHLYDFVRPGSPFGFTYPPFAALCMVPMAWLSWPATVAINLVVDLAALGFVIHRVVGPIADERRWPRATVYVWAACLAALYEPIRDTIEYGQVNLLLMGLVYADLALLGRRRGRYAGIGIGLAAAIKLTPAVFIVYLLVRRRWRAAAIAATTAATATAIAATLAPTASTVYFTRAIWDTGRIGVLSYVSNQSLMGVVARIFGQPDRLAWAVAAAAVTAAWFIQVRRADDDRIGFALTGVLACLLSPVTWIHHLVWLVPALTVAAASDRSRRRIAAAAYLVTGSGVIWIWWLDHSGPVGLLGSSLGTLAALALLAALPDAGQPLLREHREGLGSPAPPVKAAERPAAAAGHSDGGVGRGVMPRRVERRRTECGRR